MEAEDIIACLRELKQATFQEMEKHFGKRCEARPLVLLIRNHIVKSKGYDKDIFTLWELTK